jgi:soluble cytochrome b562
MKRIALASLALALTIGSVFSGEVTDFEKSLREAYGDYRKALFLTNAGKAEEAAAATEALIGKWQVISEKWSKTPPPHYADDPKWPDTLQEVSSLAAKSAEEIKSAKLQEAHETLEGVREAIGGLHARNGIISFSDRMNAYHERMEHVLTTDISALDQSVFDRLQEDAAVLKYLAETALDHPPVEASASDEFRALSKGLLASVEDLLNAARTDDAAKLKAAMQALKPAYAKLFVKYG